MSCAISRLVDVATTGEIRLVEGGRVARPLIHTHLIKADGHPRRTALRIHTFVVDNPDELKKLRTGAAPNC
jgi:hypothetical protein